MDSKPVKLSKQLVQYNDRTQEYRATHQTKYGSPGVFPIVHLFKKKMPVRSITPNKVTTHMALQEWFPPDMEYTDAEENITQHNNGAVCYDNREASISSHNVLDALKEISRKRIQAEDQAVHPHSSKRQRSESYVDATTEFSSGHSVSNFTVHVTEVPPVINAITASLTSSRTYMVHPRRSIKETIQHVVEEKRSQRNVETQTNNLLQDESKETSLYVLNSEEKAVRNKDTFKKSTIPSSSIIPTYFNETSFETVKKNKLAILLSSLTGTKAELLPYQHELTTTSANAKELSHPQIKPVSIISPKNKPKHNKHVTFAVPEKENTDDVSVNMSKSDDVDANKTECDKPLPPTVTAHLIRKEEGASDNQSNSENENLTYSSTSVASGNRLAENTPSSVYSSIKTPFNSKQEMPLIVTDRVTSEGPKIEVAPAVDTNPLSNISTSTKVGGFKFDFKNDETVQNKSSASSVLSVSDSYVKSYLCSNNFNSANNSLSQTKSSPAVTNMSMFLAGSLAPSASVLRTNVNSQITNTDLSYEGSSNPYFGISASTFNRHFNANTYNSDIHPKCNANSSQFGSNTTVTSAFGTNMLLSTGLGTSAVVTTIATPISLPMSTTSVVSSTSSLTPSVSNFGANQAPQTFGSNFRFQTTKLSVLPTNSGMSSNGFKSPAFPNTTPKSVFNFVTNSTTNFCANNNNSAGSTGQTSVVFGSTLNLPPSGSKPDGIHTATPTAGLNLHNSFSSPLFGQLKHNPNKQTTDSGDHKPTFGECVMTPNAFGATITSENNVFGAARSNLNAHNFRSNAFQSVSPQGNPLFGSSVGTIPSQPETFTIATSNVVPSSNTCANVFSFEGQNDVCRTEKTNPFNTSTVLPSFIATPNSAFSSVTPAFGSSANPFCVSVNTGFSSSYNTSRIFNIGSGTSYPKSRSQLKGRRRT